MMKFFRATILFAAIGAVISAGGLTTSAPAQDQAKKQIEKKTATTGDDVEVGTVEIYRAKNGWRYRIKSAANKTIAQPAVDYETPDDVMKILDQVKATLNKAKVKVLKDTKKKGG